MRVQNTDPPPRSAEELYKIYLARQRVKRVDDAERLNERRKE
jgi:hypothetical protein